jgi:membrane protease YdiL (CAAX protease family)
MKDLLGRQPLLSSLALVLAYDLGMQALGAALAAVFPGLTYLPKAIVVQGIFCLLIVALVGRLGWRREAGFRRPFTVASLLAYLPWLVLPALMATDIPGTPASAGLVLGYAALMLMVGFGEEALLRGIVLRALLPGGVMRAAILSSVVFGLAHLTNMFEGRDALATVVQAVYATFLGLGFAGPRLFSGTIWPAIALHGLVDFVDAAGRGFARTSEAKPVTAEQALLVLVITGLYALYGLWLVRRTRRRMAERNTEG